jgi:pyruvate ferredoxin oxidoreductase beta subunit
VESGVVLLYEVENGTLRLTGKTLSIARSGRKRPVTEYLQLQGRFKKMNAEQTADFQRQVDERWEELMKRAEL